MLLLYRCPYLHRNAGDTERRYHLRYYKTSTCVYETDVRGFCVKNGPHCAFAHGPGDLRQPVYDRRELQGEDDDRVSLLSNLEKDKGVLVDDPRWQGSVFHCTQVCADGANTLFIAFNTMYMSCQPTMLCWLRTGHTMYTLADPCGNYLKGISELLCMDSGYWIHAAHLLQCVYHQ